MTLKPQSSIYRPLDFNEVVAVTSPSSTRIARLAALDHRVLSGNPHSLGPGGASSLFSRAVDKALVNEMAEQLREGPLKMDADASEIRKWASEIIGRQV